MLKYVNELGLILILLTESSLGVGGDEWVQVVSVGRLVIDLKVPDVAVTLSNKT